MNRTIERWCVYAGPLFLIIFGVGFWLVGGLVPPPSPNTTAPELAAFYAEHATRIRIGLMISMLAAGLTAPFAVAIFMQMKRIEGVSARWDVCSSPLVCSTRRCSSFR